MEQRKVIAVIAAFAAVALLSTAIVDWRTGIMAGLLAALFMVIPDILDGIVPEEHMSKVRFGLRPLCIAALLVLVFSFPYLLTPGPLAPTVPLSELESNLGASFHRRIFTEGAVSHVEPLPFAIGSDNIVVLELEDREARLATYYAIGDTEPFPPVGSRVRLGGVVQRYGGPEARFVAHSLSPLE